MQISVSPSRGDLCTKVALLLFILVFGPVGAAAQPFDLETPGDSPIWWTVDSELTPEGLRIALTDPANIHQRHLAAVRAGRAEAAPAKAYDALVFFVDPKTNPELVPLAVAYILFANNECLLLPPEAVAKRLHAAGLSKEGANVLASKCQESSSRNRELAEAVRAHHSQALDLRAKWLAVNGNSEKSRRDLEAALRTQDIAAFRNISTHPPEELALLLRFAFRNPPIEVAADALRELKNSLSETDWNIFRKYMHKWSGGLGIIMDVQSWKFKQ